jgi:hypothetical protein
MPSSQDGATTTKSTILKNGATLEKWKEFVLHNLCIVHPEAATAVANSTALPVLDQRVPYTQPPLATAFPDTPSGKAEHARARMMAKDDNDYAKMENERIHTDEEKRAVALGMIKDSVTIALWTDISSKHPEFMTAMWARDPVALYNATVSAMTKKEFGDTEVMKLITAVVALADVVRADDKTNSLIIDSEIKRQVAALFSSVATLATVDPATTKNKTDLVMGAFKMCSLSTSTFSEVVELEKPKLNLNTGISSFPADIAAIRRAIESSTYIKKLESTSTSRKENQIPHDSITRGQQVNNAKTISKKKKNGTAKTGNRSREKATSAKEEADPDAQCTVHPNGVHLNRDCRSQQPKPDTKNARKIAAAAAIQLDSDLDSSEGDFSTDEDDKIIPKKWGHVALQTNRAGTKGTARSPQPPVSILDTGTNVPFICAPNHPHKPFPGPSTEITGIGGDLTLKTHAKCKLTGIRGFSAGRGSVETTLFGLPGIEQHYDFAGVNARETVNEAGEKVTSIHSIVFRDRRSPGSSDLVFKRCYEGPNAGLLVLQTK